MNRKTVDAIDTLPEEAFLLPWYVNGTLDAAERRQVEKALAASPELRAELALLRSIEDAVVETTDAMPAPDADGFEKLMARIEAEPARAAVARPVERRAGLMARIGAFFETSWRPAMAAAAVVIAVQATAIVALVDRGSPGEGFATASGPAAVAPTAPRFLVSFAEGATMADIVATLEAADVTIVAGPQAGGFFVVSAAGDAAQALAALQSKPAVVTQADRMP
ncbi:MAG: hypothetical protein AB7P02_11970 [Alphaproteobacteria bacterium]